MFPIISSGHSAYQDTFISDFIAIYPNPFALSKSTWKTIIEFWYLDLSLTDSRCRFREVIFILKTSKNAFKRLIAH